MEKEKLYVVLCNEFTYDDSDVLESCSTNVFMGVCKDIEFARHMMEIMADNILNDPTAYIGNENRDMIKIETEHETYQFNILKVTI